MLVGLGIALVGQIEGHVLHPLVMGRHVSLHPFVVSVGVSAGTILGGLVGAIVAIPVMGVGWAVFSTLRTPPEPDEPDVVVRAAAGVTGEPAAAAG
ncbi:AI-2E family transporter [Cellulosimicrobium sp. PMB13]